METPAWSFSQSFTVQFQALRSDLESRIESAKSGGPVGQETIQELSILLSKATKALADATGSIPSYDQKQCELQLKGIEKSIELLRPSTSKSKFSFKRKPAATSTGSTPVPAVIPTPVPTIAETAATDSLMLTLSDRTNEHITIRSLPEHKPRTDLSIANLKGCIIDLLPLDAGDKSAGSERLELSALHVRNISDSVILLPCMDGSALLHDVVNCILVLGCHQFRMHTSTKVDIFLSIGSNPIIEDCKQLRFSTYPSSITNPPLTVHQSLPTVQDFSHIRSTPSPNFSIMDESTEHAAISPIISFRLAGGGANIHESVNPEFLPQY